MKGRGKEGNIAEGQTLKRLMEKTLPLPKEGEANMDGIEECVRAFISEVASLLLYIKTLHFSVSQSLL